MTDAFPRSILRPGSTCWKQLPLPRHEILIDGDAYYADLYRHLLDAERSIFLLDWEVDSRLRLGPAPGTEDRGAPAELAGLLDYLVRRKPDLQVYLLCWDFPAIYLPEREAFTSVKFDWGTHPRVNFRLDAAHPMTGSQHQKLAVIDDRLAWCGGIDLTAHRWDVTGHPPQEPRRVNVTGEPYQPFHDLMLRVEGQAAWWLGRLARERWRRATGERLPIGEMPGDPVRSRPDGATLGIARTLPAYKVYRQVREVERLHIATITAARDWVYIENQFFTARRVAQALERSLREEQGPQVVIVLPKESGSWLERRTMGLLRAYWLNRVAQADRHDRLRLFFPDDPALPAGQYITVHAKVVIADGRYARIGSANLNNRSMGLDTECDLMIDAGRDEEAQRGVLHLLWDLLADHHGTDREAARAAWEAHPGDLFATLEALAPPEGKSLRGLTLPEPPSTSLSDADDLELLDLEQPVVLERVLDRQLHVGHQKGPLQRMLQHPITGIGLTLALCLGVSALWLYTPLGRTVADWTAQQDAGAGMALLVAALYVLGGLVMIPLNLLIVVTVSIFPAVPGVALALSASLASAWLTYGVGNLAGKRFFSKSIQRARDRFKGRKGRFCLLSVLVVRMVPVLPFSVLNYAAGAARIRLREYLLGTLLGLLPGTLALTGFQRSLLAMLEDPSPTRVVIAAGFLAVVALLGWWLHRRFGSQ